MSQVRGSGKRGTCWRAHLGRKQGEVGSSCRGVGVDRELREGKGEGRRGEEQYFLQNIIIHLIVPTRLKHLIKTSECPRYITGLFKSSCHYN